MPTRSETMHRTFLATLALCLSLQSGCVTQAPGPSSAVGESLGVLAIAPAQFVPESNFVTFAKSAGAGAAKGATILGGTAAGGAAAMAAMAAGTLVYPVAVLAGVLMVVEAATVGGVAGAKAAVSPETAKLVESNISRAVAGLDTQNQLAGHVASLLEAESWIRLSSTRPAGPGRATAHPDYAQWRSAGIDTVLETAVTDIGFESCGSEMVRRLSSGCTEARNKRMVDLFMSARARLVRVSDGTELFARELHYKSARREIPYWVEKDGQPIAEEIEYGYRELAERVRDELILVAPIALPAPATFPGVPGVENPKYGICWLAPVYPPAKPLLLSEIAGPARKRSDVCPASGLHFSDVDSLRPTLRWSAFPRELDRRALDPADLQKIANVTYDLKIWREEGCERGLPVYERSGLTRPEHLLERSLAPGTRYFWSVRARFTLASRPMVTRWSHFDPTTCFPADIADWQYHRFVTPK